MSLRLHDSRHNCLTDINMLTPLNSLTEQVGACMRSNGIKRATGSWSDYWRALEIVKVKIKTQFPGELKEIVFNWVSPK
jgi:hypothetical protein